MDSKLEQAKEWASRIKSEFVLPTRFNEATLAAAEVIQSLPDTVVDGDKLREVIEEARLLISDGEPEIILNDLAALLPAPRPRTLADMTPEELEWPGSTPDDVAYVTGGALTTQDVVDECRAVRKERALPCPEDVPAGEPWLVKYDGYDWVGTRELKEEIRWPWALARIDGTDYSMARDSDIALVSRLVPERKENA